VKIFAQNVKFQMASDVFSKSFRFSYIIHFSAITQIFIQDFKEAAAVFGMH